MRPCSTIGPRHSAGKKVNAATITMTPTKAQAKVRPLVGNVPTESGTDFFVARFPAIARTAEATPNRPTNIVTPKVRL
jgi:hypothetical protein